MADNIGSLGLDVSEFEAGISQATNRIAQAINSTNQLNTAVSLSAAAIAIWARNFIDFKQRADATDKAIKGVARTLSGPEFTTESALEVRLKEVDSLLEDLQTKTIKDSFFEKISDFFTGENSDSKQDAAGTAAITKRKEIEESLGEKIRDRTKLMEIERTQGKDAADIERIRLEYAEKRGQVTAANGRLTDAEYKALKAAEAEEVKGVSQRRLEREEKITQELKDQLSLMKAQNSGASSTALRRLQSENEFDRRIRDDYDKNNGKNVEAIDMERREANKAFAIEEHNKTPAQRRAERAAKRKANRDAIEVENEDRESDRRIAQGIKGSPGSRIERRREELKDAANRSSAIRKNFGKDEIKGFSTTDSKNLQDIATAFKTKGTA